MDILLAAASVKIVETPIVGVSPLIVTEHGNNVASLLLSLAYFHNYCHSKVRFYLNRIYMLCLNRLHVRFVQSFKKPISLPFLSGYSSHI